MLSVTAVAAFPYQTSPRIHASVTDVPGQGIDELDQARRRARRAPQSKHSDERGAAAPHVLVLTRMCSKEASVLSKA